MDLRLLIVILPLLIAFGWVFYNIRSAALQQGKDFLNKE